jgi:hypothetical protein
VPVIISLVLLLFMSNMVTWSLTRSIAAQPVATLAATSAATAAVKPPDPATSPYQLGDQVTSLDGLANATVFAYQQPTARTAPTPAAPGTEWGAVDIRVCSIAVIITVSPTPWRLVYADGGIVQPSNAQSSQFPSPQYPFIDHVVPVGQCVRGWLVFPALKNKRPARVEYAPDRFLPEAWAL